MTTSFRFLQHHLGHLDVAVCGFVEGGTDYFGLWACGFHVRDFFGPFVDEQDDEHDLGVVFDDRVRQMLQQDCFSAFWGCYYERPLPLAEW